MLCNPMSYYPEKIDEMIFFQDNSLEKTESIHHYNKLISRGKYSEADDYINQQENLYGYFADFFNLIENRICSLQEYSLKKPLKNQPFLFYDKKGYGIHIFSDTNEEEELKNIKLFSPDDGKFTDTETLYVFDHQDPESLKIYVNDTEMKLEEIEPPLVTEDTIWF